VALNHCPATSHLGVLVALANHDQTFNLTYVGSIPTAPTIDSSTNFELVFHYFGPFRRLDTARKQHPRVGRDFPLGDKLPSSSGLGRNPFKVVTGVRIPLGVRARSLSMSRTHSHKNYIGRFSQEEHLHEIHDHRHGECDLPSRKEWERLLKESRQPHLLFKDFRCVWDFPIDYYIKNKVCGCAMCTGSYDRHHEKRKERHKWKAIEREHSLTEIKNIKDCLEH
jgi:hypothetical protein